MASAPSHTETARHVTYEANQIGRNFECLGQHAAAAATAEHIRRFWAPLLRAELFRQARQRPGAFSPIARDAVSLLQ